MADTALIETPRAEVAAQYDTEELTFAQRVALDPSIDIERLKAVIEMENAAQDREANKQFEAAFAAMQPDLPAVEKAGQGQNNSEFAKLEAIQAAARPILQKHGFSYRFKQQDKDGAITLRCTLSHMSGGSDFDEMTLPYDVGGQKNAVQARGSTVSYGKRYTLCNVLGIQLGGEDNDGQIGRSGETLTADQVKQVRDQLAKLGQKDDAILTWAGTRGFGATELENVPAEAFDTMIGQLNHWVKVRSKNNG
jgi:hypothetical protein